MVDHDSKYAEHMNSALDQGLSAAEAQELQARLNDSPETAELWSRLKRVDWLLRNTPMVAPSAEFAGRVMAAVAVMGMPRIANKRLALGIVLGLLVAAMLAVPVMSVALILLFRTITDPSTFSTVFQAVASALGYVVGVVSDAGSRLDTLVHETPMVPALLSTVIPLAMLWGWLVWYLSGGRQSGSSGGANSTKE